MYLNTCIAFLAPGEPLTLDPTVSTSLNDPEREGIGKHFGRRGNK